MFEAILEHLIHEDMQNFLRLVTIELYCRGHDRPLLDLLCSSDLSPEIVNVCKMLKAGHFFSAGINAGTDLGAWLLGKSDTELSGLLQSLTVSAETWKQILSPEQCDELFSRIWKSADIGSRDKKGIKCVMRLQKRMLKKIFVEAYSEKLSGANIGAICDMVKRVVKAALKTGNRGHVRTYVDNVIKICDEKHACDENDINLADLRGLSECVRSIEIRYWTSGEF
jgi:hypothetical protein